MAPLLLEPLQHIPWVLHFELSARELAGGASDYVISFDNEFERYVATGSWTSIMIALEALR